MVGLDLPSPYNFQLKVRKSNKNGKQIVAATLLEALVISFCAQIFLEIAVLMADTLHQDFAKSMTYHGYGHAFYEPESS